jgi:AcrR family transcriptional regulator
MDKDYKEIMEKVRDLSSTLGIRSLSIDEICNKLSISKSTFSKYISNKTDLVEQVLKFERSRFQSIFDEYDFEGVNAIKILLIVSKEIAMRFKDVTPSMTFDLQKFYPELYKKHFKERQDFIFMKIQINLTKGINQGMYRPDLSIELVSRLYLSRLNDMHNPELFPPEQFSDETLFNFMIDYLIRGIATPDGIAFYEKEKDNYKL